MRIASGMRFAERTFSGERPKISVSSLRTDVEVDAAVKAVVKARVPGGVRALVGAIGSQDRGAIRNGFDDYWHLEAQLGQPFRRLAEQAGLREALMVRYREAMSERD